MEIFINFSFPSLDPLAAISGSIGLITIAWFVIIGKKDSSNSNIKTPIKVSKETKKKRGLFG